MLPHRYWRIYITRSTFGATMQVCLYEVEFRGTPGGPDQCDGGVASASHRTDRAYRLFDNNPSEYWINGGPSEDSWFQYDFGAGHAVIVAEIKMVSRGWEESPEDFVLQWSDDGTHFTTAASWSGINDWIGGLEKLFVVSDPPPPPTPPPTTPPWQFRCSGGRVLWRGNPLMTGG
ncbi:MAG: discoidin domain-containing protein [Magnetococcales bacterium]|nr:discoidin domain-containing protein [Magnetococcales bacterium]